ncbi:hypothetical protein FO519_001460 [Halicephalobus sp. NKZ332]|nr:hypothetical protein FO519_001460 [Halicephalobus sp. NKZ332]
MNLPRDFFIKLQKCKSDKVLLSVFLLSDEPGTVNLIPSDDRKLICRVTKASDQFEVILDGLTCEGLSEGQISPKKPLVFEVTLSSLNLDPELLPAGFRKVRLPDFLLFCKKCENMLAEIHDDYVVELEEAQEVMETAMGCCRCCGRGDMHCGHLTEPSSQKMLMDKCVPLVLEDYFLPLSITVNRHLVSCSRCSTIFGRKRISEFIEIEPLCADFKESTSNSLILSFFKSLGSYFALRLSQDATNHLLICDYDGTKKMILGFFSKQFLWLSRGKASKKGNALGFMFNHDEELLKRDMGTKVYFPSTAIDLFLKEVENSHELIKDFDHGIGIWKVGF